MPKGETLGSAFEHAKLRQPPSKVSDVPNNDLRLLASLCRELQEIAGDQPFILCQTSVAKLFGHSSHRTISNWMTPMGRCTSRSILRAPLGQSSLDLTIGTGWWADMRTAQASLMDSSLSRQTVSSPSIIPGQPLRRLTESVRRDLSVVVTSMLPALPTES